MADSGMEAQPSNGLYVADIETEGGVKFRRFVVCPLEGRINVRMALYDAYMEYVRLFTGAPQFAFIRKLPKGAENGQEVGGMLLFEAEWMLERCVAVGGRATPPPTPPQMDERHLERGEPTL